MASVTYTEVRARAGLTATQAPTDTVISSFIDRNAQYVADRIGKSSIDVTNCTHSEALCIELFSAFDVILVTPMGTEPYHIAKANAYRDQGELVLSRLAPGWTYEIRGVTT